MAAAGEAARACRPSGPAFRDAETISANPRPREWSWQCDALRPGSPGECIPRCARSLQRRPVTSVLSSTRETFFQCEPIPLRALRIRRGRADPDLSEPADETTDRGRGSVRRVAGHTLQPRYCFRRPLAPLLPASQV